MMPIFAATLSHAFGQPRVAAIRRPLIFDYAAAAFRILQLQPASAELFISPRLILILRRLIIRHY
jgi:hypothetical protein